LNTAYFTFGYSIPIAIKEKAANIYKKINMNNNIQEDYVSFEVAKLLKEKDFSVDCMHRWDSSFNGLEFNISDIENDWNCNYLSKPYFTSAPSHALAIKWIRENFAIDISVHCDMEERNFYCYTITIVKQMTFCRLEFNKGNFKDSERATEAALLYTLKNIIK
jgi:hypothetical protein